MKLRFFVIVSLLFLSSYSVVAKKEYRIQNGILDLKIFSVEDIQNTKLDGYWEFYWDQLLTPQDFQNSKNTLNPHYEKVPKSWTSYEFDSLNLPNKGYATYRLIINKKADITETIYGLKISSVFSNYKLWVNGNLLSEVGKVGETKKISKPKFQFQDIPFILDPDKGSTKQVEIVIQVSNFSHQRAGLQKPIFFGKYENLKSDSRWMDILNLIIIGIILVIGINHLNMYLFRRKAISNLYFSIVCIVMIVRNITTGDRIITYIFPNINWELLVKLDNFTGFGTIPLFALFIYSLYKVDFPKIMRDIMLGIGIAITLLVFATPANFYGKFRMFFEIYILIFGLYLTFGVLLKSAIRRRPTAFFTFLGMFILYSTAINDVLSSMGLIQTAYVAPYGLVTFMFIQSITITVKSAKAINKNEELSSELQIEKINLEKNINERTQELRSQHDELVKHKEKEQEQSWLNNGVAIVNDILADNKDDFKVLSSTLLKQLIKYVGAATGVLYMLNNDDEKEQAFELIADYGCNNDIRKNKTTVHVSTGNYGIVYSENKEIVMNDVPENYLKIESGMGSTNPAALLIVPLSIDEQVFGIIELASLKKFTKLETELIKRIANNIASNLNNIRMNEKSSKLIKKFEEQAILMQEKEEEMRQNIEEMETIREQYEELLKKSKEG